MTSNINLASSISNFNSNFLNVTTSEKANELKQKFFTATGYTQEDLDTTDPIKQQEILTKYAQFLSDQLNSMYQIESIVGLSPEEIKLRNIMFETFNIVLKMLNALQMCTRAISNAQVVYTKWQKEYTDMMTRIPLYVQKASKKVVINTTNFGETTFGYGSIRLVDVLNSIVQRALASPDSAPSNAQVIFSNRFFEAKYNSSSNSLELWLNHVDGNPNYFYASVTVPKQPENPYNVVNTLVQLLYENYKTSTAAWTNSDGSTVDGITWSNIVDSGTDDENKARAGLRGEVNGRLQLYIENARSLKQQVQDMGKPIDNLVNQTQEAIQNQTQLLTAITESLKGLIAAIFR